MRKPNLVRPITRADIKGPAIYAGMRDDYRRGVIELKKPRRVIIGDRVELVFDNRHTLTLQIEETCRLENLTRDDQIEAEIALLTIPQRACHEARAGDEHQGSGDFGIEQQRAKTPLPARRGRSGATFA